MEPAFWIQAWQDGRTAFHRDAPHPALERWGPGWLEGAERVFVPLCGKSLDLMWLRGRGLEVTGVELADQALRAFADEQGLDLREEPEPPFTAYRAPRLTLLRGDLFELTPAVAGPFERIWDRASLVAVNPTDREVYAERLLALLAPGGSILLNAMAYDQSAMQGPPWSVTEEEVRRLYPGLPVTCLQHEEVEDPLRYEGRGLRRWTVGTYRIGPA